MAVVAAGCLQDLYVFDPVGMTWTNLSASVSGTPPSARGEHGFASAGGELYVHGGCDQFDSNGNCDGEVWKQQLEQNGRVTAFIAK